MVLARWLAFRVMARCVDADGTAIHYFELNEHDTCQARPAFSRTFFRV